MSVLASTFEIGAHPATALLVGGLAAAVLRGRFASFALILAPLLVWDMYQSGCGDSIQYPFIWL